MTYELDSPLGALLLTERGGAVTALRFALPGERGQGSATPGTPAEEAARWLRRYFAGEEPGGPPPLAPEGTAFQRRVWAAAKEIPYGETRSYGELAAVIGCRSARAVGAALAKNPIWILIPCHRVIGCTGKLTGYAGGLEKKATLLALEQRAGMKK